MKKIFQRLVDKEKGDCMQATTASLLGLDYDMVPKFVESPNGWFAPFFALVTGMGLRYKGMLHNPFPVKEDSVLYQRSNISQLHTYNGVDGFFLAAVYSPKYFDEHEYAKGRTTMHSVIIDKEYNIVHDPNPLNRVVTKYPMADQLGYNGLIHVIIVEQ